METLKRRILIYSGVFVLILISLFPFLFMLAVSLSSDINFMLGDSYRATLDNYKEIILREDINFPRYILNSLIVSSLSALLSLSFGSLSAYYLSRKALKPVRFLAFIFFLSMFPPVSTVGFLFNAFSFLGLINTFVPLILTHTAWSIPLGVWVMFSYFSKIPKDIERAAVLDGAGFFDIFLKILIPLSKPALAGCYVLLFLFSFNEFMFAYIFTIDHSSRTVPVGIALFEGLYGQTPWGYIMAGAFISILPVFAAVILLQRHIVGGLTGGAVR